MGRRSSQPQHCPPRMNASASCARTVRPATPSLLLESVLPPRCRRPLAFASARNDWSRPTVQPRGDYHPRCVLRVLIAHKSGSTEIESFFERLCGPKVQAPASTPQGLTVLALVRDLTHRAISTYNMWLNGRNARSSREEFSYLSSRELLRTQTAQPDAEDVRWRFARFLGWLATDPPLTPGQQLGSRDYLAVMRRWHYRPQSRYFGVGAREGSMPNITLMGRVEALPIVVARLIRSAPLVAAAHDRVAAAAVPPWRGYSSALLRGWKMSPCLMDDRLRELVRAAFQPDGDCLDPLLRNEEQPG